MSRIGHSYVSLVCYVAPNLASCIVNLFRLSTLFWVMMKGRMVCSRETEGRSR